MTPQCSLPGQDAAETCRCILHKYNPGSDDNTNKMTKQKQCRPQIHFHNTLAFVSSNKSNYSIKSTLVHSTIIHINHNYYLLTHVYLLIIKIHTQYLPVRITISKIEHYFLLSHFIFINPLTFQSKFSKIEHRHSILLNP